MSARSRDEKPTAEVESEQSRAQGKGRPTPSRKEAQAANARPLVPNKFDKAAVKARRASDREAREKARVGAMMGDERYLPARDKGPQRKWIRDTIDARFSLGELMIPLMLIVLVLTFIPDERLQFVVLAVIWIYVIVCVIDAVLVGRRLHRKLGEKFGAENVQPGTKMYAGMRTLQMRYFRFPKPQVKRGAKID